MKRLFSPAGISLALTLMALAQVGAGPINGDAAVYQHQAVEGILDERTIHVGYVTAAAAMARIGPVGVLLDVLGCVCLGLLAFAASRLAEREGGDGRAAALAVGAFLLAWAPFAEVDLPWGAALTIALIAPVWAAGALMTAAITVSPLALVSLPWAALTRRGWKAAALGLVLWIPVLVWCWEDWWSGPRGVLVSQSTDTVGRVLLQWIRAILLPGLMAPGILGLIAGGRRLAIHAAAAGVPLFLLVRHADVPGWLPLSVVMAVAVGLGAKRWTWGRAWLWVPLVLQVGAVWWQGDRRRGEIRGENARITALAEDVGEDEVLVAPWSDGVRFGALRGDPEAGWLSFGAAREALPEVVYVLPVGRDLGVEGYDWTRREDGVWVGRRVGEGL